MTKQTNPPGTNTSDNKDQHRVCPYEQCLLPDDNKHYWFQFGYLIICSVLLLFNNQSLTFFSLAMYIAPIGADLISIKMEKWCKYVKGFFLVFNGIFLFWCLLGLAQAVIDKIDHFAIIKTLLPIPPYDVPKNWFGYVLPLDILVPIFLLVGSPTRQMIEQKNKILTNTNA